MNDTISKAKTTGPDAPTPIPGLACAREERADLLADDILKIADDGRLDTTNGRLAAACAT